MSKSRYFVRVDKGNNKEFAFYKVVSNPPPSQLRFSIKAYFIGGGKVETLLPSGVFLDTDEFKEITEYEAALLL